MGRVEPALTSDQLGVPRKPLSVDDAYALERVLAKAEAGLRRLQAEVARDPSRRTKLTPPARELADLATHCRCALDASRALNAARRADGATLHAKLGAMPEQQVRRMIVGIPRRVRDERIARARRRPMTSVVGRRHGRREPRRAPVRRRHRATARASGRSGSEDPPSDPDPDPSAVGRLGLVAGLLPSARCYLDALGSLVGLESRVWRRLELEGKAEVRRALLLDRAARDREAEEELR